MPRNYMSFVVLSCSLLDLGCSGSSYQKSGDRQNPGQSEKGAEDKNDDSDLDKDGDPAPEALNDELEESVEAPDAPPTEATPIETDLDPDALRIPVVFHFDQSRVWDSEDQMRAIVSEIQRIYDQANIVLEPSYTDDGQAGPAIDVTFVPSIGGGGTNGISFGGRASDIQVRDDVQLGQVDDQRPAKIKVPFYVKDAKDVEKIAVKRNDAEQARTIAHEVGHQLGLPHRQDRTNLMASGTTGWTLNDTEIAALRRSAANRFPGQD